MPANVPVSEQELSTQVALFYDIIISDCDLALGTHAQTHHCKVLDELTSKSPCPNQEYLQPQLLWSLWVRFEHSSHMCCVQYSVAKPNQDRPV